jgi:hypothetical protein
MCERWPAIAEMTAAYSPWPFRAGNPEDGYRSLRRCRPPRNVVQTRAGLRPLVHPSDRPVRGMALAAITYYRFQVNAFLTIAFASRRDFARAIDRPQALSCHEAETLSVVRHEQSNL